MRKLEKHDEIHSATRKKFPIIKSFKNFDDELTITIIPSLQHQPSTTFKNILQLGLE